MIQQNNDDGYRSDAESLSSADNSDVVVGDSSDEESYDFNVQHIYRDDYRHMVSIKQNNIYYIGICAVVSNYLLFLASVSVKTFFKYPFGSLLKYLQIYSVSAIKPRKIHIMKLYIDFDMTYRVILKTHWLRLVQRHWKKVFRERQLILTKRMSLCSLAYREITGKYLPGLDVLPDLLGMLSHYSNVIKYKN
jgi:hypothetical protein